MERDPKITHRTPLQERHEDGIPLPDETILTFDFGNLGKLELRHKGTYIEVHRTGGASLTRLTVEPVVSNQVWLRLEPPYQEGR